MAVEPAKRSVGEIEFYYPKDQDGGETNPVMVTEKASLGESELLLLLPVQIAVRLLPLEPVSLPCAYLFLWWQNSSSEPKFSRFQLRQGAVDTAVCFSFCFTELPPITQIHTPLLSVNASLGYYLNNSFFVCRKRTVQLGDFHCIAMLGRGHFGKVVWKCALWEGGWWDCGCEDGPQSPNRNTAVQKRFVAMQIYKTNPAQPHKQVVTVVNSQNSWRFVASKPGENCPGSASYFIKHTIAIPVWLWALVE